MKILGLVFCLFLTCITIGFESNAQKLLNLEESIQIGLQNQYSIKIAKKRELQASNDNTPGNAGFLPTINATSGLNYTISGLNQEFFGGD